MQLKYSNYVAFSHFHGKAVNNSGLNIREFQEKRLRKIFQSKINLLTLDS